MSAAQGPAPVPAPHCAGAGVGVGVGVGVGRSAGVALAVPGLGRCPVTAVKNVQFPSDDWPLVGATAAGTNDQATTVLKYLLRPDN